METDLAEIFLILDVKRQKYADSLVLAPIEKVPEIQTKIRHIDELKKHLSEQLKIRRKLNAHN